MEEALMELEAFQTSSDDYVAADDAADDAAYANPHYFNDDENQIIETMEVSLLFPSIEATTHPTPIVNDTTMSLALSSDAGENALQAEDSSTEGKKLEAIWRARWLLVAAAALYGTNFSVVKLLGDEMPVGISTSLRFGLAALATLPWLVQGYFPGLLTNNKEHDKEEFDRRRMATLYGLEVGLWNSIGYVAQAVGLETTLASESAFLCSMAVVIVPLLDWIAGKKLLSRQWAGAVLALVGVAFLELGDVDALMSSSGSVFDTGTQLSLIQPLTFGLGFWRMEQAMNKFPQEAPRMTAAQLMAIFVSSVGYGLWSMGVFEPFFASSDVGSALTGFQSALSGVSTSFPWNEWSRSPSILFSLFWTGCITTALTIYMETLALESLSAAETTLIFSTEPLWGTAFAVALMGEQMGVNSVVGAGLILTACIYSNLGVTGIQELWTSTMQSLDTKKAVGKKTR
jgi:drug/metabolite transporter (DMT)-like permease